MPYFMKVVDSSRGSTALDITFLEIPETDIEEIVATLVDEHAPHELVRHDNGAVLFDWFDGMVYISPDYDDCWDYIKHQFNPTKG